MRLCLCICVTLRVWNKITDADILQAQCLLTHLPLVPHMGVNKSCQHWPIRHQVIINKNGVLLLIGTPGTNFSEILIKAQNFSVTKMHLIKKVWEMAAIFWWDEFTMRVNKSYESAKVSPRLFSWCLIGAIGIRTWAFIHLTVRRLTARSREVSKPRDSCLDFSNRSEIWKPSRQISERYDHYNTQSRGFETSRDLAVRRLTA